MKIIHCSDLHLDSKIDSLPTDKSLKRREEVLHSFERLCDYSVKNNVEVVIIAGDMFDEKKCSKKSFERVMFAINQTNPVKFLYLNGNHDDKLLEENKDKLASNLLLFNEGFNVFNFNGVSIAGLSIGLGLSKACYDYVNFNENDFNILVMHGEAVDFIPDKLEDNVVLPLLKDRNVDYLALGHYHSYSVNKLDARGVYSYSGCLDGRGFDETGVKGFVLVDTDAQDKYKFVPFSSRIYVETTFSISEFADYLSARKVILKEIVEKYSNDCLVKLVLVGEIKPDFELDVDELKSRLNELFFYAKIEDKTQLKISLEEYANDKSVKGEFVRLVLQSDLTDEVKKQVLTCGIDALKGEDVI